MATCASIPLPDNLRIHRIILYYFYLPDLLELALYNSLLEYASDPLSAFNVNMEGHHINTTDKRVINVLAAKNDKNASWKKTDCVINGRFTPQYENTIFSKSVLSYSVYNKQGHIRYYVVACARKDKGKYENTMLSHKSDRYNAMNTKLRLFWSYRKFHTAKLAYQAGQGPDPYKDTTNVITLGEFLNTYDYEYFMRTGKGTGVRLLLEVFGLIPLRELPPLPLPLPLPLPPYPHPPLT